MGVTTKAGDSGFTFFPGAGSKVRKDDPRIECLGALDELDAFLARCELNSRFASLIGEIRETFTGAVMSAAAQLTEAGIPGGIFPQQAALPDPAKLERHIAELEQRHPVRGFIRSWRKGAAADLNIARTVCRRAERRLVEILYPAAVPGSDKAGSRPAEQALLAWLNRLSDLLFLLAIEEN